MMNRNNEVEELMPLRKRLSLRFEIEDQYVVVVEPPLQQQQQVEELPEKFKNKIMEMGGGTEETLITKKTLTKTDVDEGEARLSLPMSSLLSHSFLTSDEKEKTVNRIKRDREGGLTVEVIDPRLEVWELKMRRLDMEKKKKMTNKGKRGKTSSMYVLAYKWNHVVKANSLRQGDHLQLWSFRSQQRLCIAIVLLQGEERGLLN